MTLVGLPLHILVVHAAVVFTPLACLVAIAYVVVPGWRWVTRWPSGVWVVLTGDAGARAVGG